MKHIKLNFFPAIILIVVFIAGCGGLGKMVKEYDVVKYTVTPEVLETHGGKIAVGVKGTFPDKYFHPKAIVTVTPVLKYEGGQTELKPITIRGEMAEGEGTVIKKTGGSFNYSDVIDYTQEMKAAELLITVGAKIKAEAEPTILKADHKIADGVIYTSERVEGDGEIILADHGYEKVTLVYSKGDIFFAYNNSNHNKYLALNKDIKSKDKLTAISEFLEKGWEIKSIDINAWASPEGEETLNQNLSDKRSKVADKYMKRVLRKLKIKDEISVNLEAKGEDFDGFMTALNTSELKDKNSIKNVIQSQATKYEREQRIKEMTVIYSEVEDMLSVLRRAEIVVNCYEPKKTDDEIAEFSTSKPDTLSIKELLYAATLTEDLNLKLKIYNNAITVYPQDWKPYNNAGFVCIKQGKIEDAESFFKKANALASDEGMVFNNMGVAAIYQKDYDGALASFESAQGKGTDVSFNKGIVNLAKAEYAQAVSDFGSMSCRYNIGLAQMMNQDNDAAIVTLKCTKENAASLYLLSVAGARADNKALMLQNLKKAVQADAKYREQAQGDREFVKYFEDSDFLNAIK